MNYDWQYRSPQIPPGPACIRTSLGDDFFGEVVCVGPFLPFHLGPSPRPLVKDDDLRLVATFPKLKELDFSNTDIGPHNR